MSEPRIDALRDDAIAVHQIFGLVIVEARIVAQKFGELVKAALEFRGRDHFIHFDANALQPRRAQSREFAAT